MTKVPDWKVAVAENFGMHNAQVIADVCPEAGVYYAPACTLFEKESMGQNIYGKHDVGGTLSGFPHDVNRGNFEVFEWLVFTKGMKSNGVGPSQITWKGHFPTMKEQGLRPWVVRDNMLYGLRLLGSYHRTTGDWGLAAEAYNGSSEYGDDFVKKLAEWIQRFKAADPEG